jgi:hypothetical protein
VQRRVSAVVADRDRVWERGLGRAPSATISESYGYSRPLAQRTTAAPESTAVTDSGTQSAPKSRAIRASGWRERAPTKYNSEIAIGR